MKHTSNVSLIRHMNIVLCTIDLLHRLHLSMVNVHQITHIALPGRRSIERRFVFESRYETSCVKRGQKLI